MDFGVKRVGFNGFRGVGGQNPSCHLRLEGFQDIIALYICFCFLLVRNARTHRSRKACKRSTFPLISIGF